jgi:addiction module RelB/DinJ family antitoxin
MAEARINVRAEQAVKDQAEEVFQKLGMTLSAGVNIFLTRVAALKRIPFPLELSHEEALGAQTLALEQAAQDAVANAVSQLKATGAPIALYDIERQQPYLQYADNSREYILA